MRPQGAHFLPRLARNLPDGEINQTAWREELHGEKGTFENLLRSAVSETEDIPSAQAAAARTRNERLEQA